MDGSDTYNTNDGVNTYGRERYLQYLRKGAILIGEAIFSILTPHNDHLLPPPRSINHDFRRPVDSSKMSVIINKSSEDDLCYFHLKLSC